MVKAGSPRTPELGGAAGTREGTEGVMGRLGD